MDGYNNSHTQINKYVYSLMQGKPRTSADELLDAALDAVTNNAAPANAPPTDKSNAD
jgi:hypothetical protein